MVENAEPREGDRVYSVYKAAISYNDEWYKFETRVLDSSTNLEELLRNEGLDWEELEFDSYEDFYEAYKEEYENYAPERIFRSVHRAEAESVAQEIHQHELLNWHILDFNIPPRRNQNFNLEEWCEANNIPYQDGWSTEQEFVEILRLRFMEAFRDGNEGSKVQRILSQLTEAMYYPFSLGEWCVANGVPYENNLDDWESILEHLKSTENHELLGKLWEDAVGRFAFVHEEIVKERMYLKDEA